MTPRNKPKYDLEKISQLKIQYNNLSFSEKWDEIGKQFDRSGEAIYRWYSRHRKTKTTEEQTVEQIETLAKTSEYWRFVCTLVTGKASKDRIPDTIRKTIHFLENVLKSYDG